jgi:hypothetical protein
MSLLAHLQMPFHRPRLVPGALANHNRLCPEARGQVIVALQVSVTLFHPNKMLDSRVPLSSKAAADDSPKKYY